MNETQRFPKWVTEERFELAHEPGSALRFRFRLFDRAGVQFDGFGNSITAAAKEARKKREAPSK